MRTLVAAPAGFAPALRAALRPLEVEVDLVSDAESCIAGVRRAPVGMVVAHVDVDCGAILAGIAGRRPPVVVIERSSDAESALRWLRAGAADCIAADAALPERLRVAVRSLAEREAAGGPVDTLHTEKMASIGQLAAGVAHEINNPMGFIHANLSQMAEYVSDLRRAWGHVEELRKAVDAADPAGLRAAAARLSECVAEIDVDFLLPDLAKAIRESQEGSERIRHIVNDLREFSRQDASQRVAADLNLCLESTCNIVWPMMKHVVVLEKEYCDLGVVECYPMQLKQVFMNLLVNAYQAIEARVATSGQTGRIHLQTRRFGGEVEVRVSDDGIGIEPEHQTRIFDPFFTTKGVGYGTGLGLSTSFNIVRRHGGTIRVDSVPGCGTTFRVRLPSRAPDADDGA